MCMSFATARKRAIVRNHTFLSCFMTLYMKRVRSEWESVKVTFRVFQEGPVWAQSDEFECIKCEKAVFYAGMVGNSEFYL